jgi:hypothetical protein
LSLNTGSIKDTAGNAIQLATPAVASSANTITPPNTTLIDLISVSVVFAISASKATPTAISERVNSALLVDCTSVAESKSTAFGA